MSRCEICDKDVGIHTSFFSDDVGVWAICYDCEDKATKIGIREMMKGKYLDLTDGAVR
jgi:hypothetical protein